MRRYRTSIRVPFWGQSRITTFLNQMDLEASFQAFPEVGRTYLVTSRELTKKEEEAIEAFLRGNKDMVSK